MPNPIATVLCAVLLLLSASALDIATTGECIEGALFPNPADCASFFVCSHDSLKLMHCPAGLHFNVELSVCDYPRDAGCQAGATSTAATTTLTTEAATTTEEATTTEVATTPLETTTTERLPTTTADTTTSRTTTTPSSAECRHDCKAKGMEGRYLAHPDCTKAYKCEKKKAYITACQNGTHFNERLQYCLAPEKSQCTAGAAPEQCT